jgi:hypothetical protein
MVAGLALAASVLDAWNWNVATSYRVSGWSLPVWMEASIQSTQLLQDWRLFAPNPTRDDGWWVIEGITETGRSIDPFTGKPVDFSKPADIPALFDPLWRKAFERYTDPTWQESRAWFGRYITLQNHRRHEHGDRLAKFRFYFMKETTQPPGTPKPWDVTPVLVWEQDCFEEHDRGHLPPEIREYRFRDPPNLARATSLIRPGG